MEHVEEYLVLLDKYYLPRTWVEGSTIDDVTALLLILRTVSEMMLEPDEVVFIYYKGLFTRMDNIEDNVWFRVCDNIS